MALKNTITGEYIKIDFGYLPQPTAKKFKSEQQRQGFNPQFDNYQKVDFDIKDFNEAIKTALPDPTKTLIDNYKNLAYAKIKEQLNVKDENDVVVVIWEDC